MIQASCTTNALLHNFTEAKVYRILQNIDFYIFNELKGDNSLNIYFSAI